MAALIDLVKEGYFAPGSKVLYAHLGGQPALNAYTTAFSMQSLADVGAGMSGNQ